MEAEGLRLGGMLRERGLARVEDGQETVATLAPLAVKSPLAIALMPAERARTTVR